MPGWTPPPPGVWAQPGFVPLTGAPPDFQYKGPQAAATLANTQGNVSMIPIERQYKGAQAAKTIAELPDPRFNRAEKLRDDYRQTKAIQDYTTTLPMVASAMRAPPGAAGDLATIYAFGKVMDPGSAVREGELNLAQQTAPMSAYLDRLAQRVQTGNLLRPQERKGLIEAMRRRVSEYGSAYSQQRFNFANMAKDVGLRPVDIIGPHAGVPFQGAEADYLGRPIRNRDGTQGAKPSVHKPAGNFTRGKDGVLEWHP